MPKDQTPAKISVDFSNVGERSEGGAKGAHVPEGDYILKVLGVIKKSKKDDESSYYLSWKMAIVKPEQYKNAGVIYHNTTLKEDGLWSLRNLIEDMGLKVPKSTVSIPLATIVEKQLQFGATLEDDEYNNKIKSKIAATFKKADYVETADTKMAVKDDDEAETASDDDEDEDLDELDTDDL